MIVPGVLSADSRPAVMPRPVNCPMAAGSTPSTVRLAALATVALVWRTSVTARTPG